tara:strand:- start:499 stop:717 length:219 start_codon:yes stop_codon:yes gene_type:complete
LQGFFGTASFPNANSLPQNSPPQNSLPHNLHDDPRHANSTAEMNSKWLVFPLSLAIQRRLWQRHLWQLGRLG